MTIPECGEGPCEGNEGNKVSGFSFSLKKKKAHTNIVSIN